MVLLDPCLRDLFEKSFMKSELILFDVALYSLFTVKCSSYIIIYSYA